MATREILCMGYRQILSQFEHILLSAESCHKRSPFEVLINIFRIERLSLMLLFTFNR